MPYRPLSSPAKAGDLFQRRPSFTERPRRTGSSAFADDDSIKSGEASRPLRATYAATTAGIGSAVTDLIFSIAKREVTFFSGTALISFL